MGTVVFSAVISSPFYVLLYSMVLFPNRMYARSVDSAMLVKLSFSMRASGLVAML